MIKFLKLITGNDVVADVDDRGIELFVKFPVEIIMQAVDPDSPDKPRNQVLPFSPHLKGHSFLLKKDRILFYGEPTQELKEYYEKNFLPQVPVADDSIELPAEQESIAIESPNTVLNENGEVVKKAA